MAVARGGRVHLMSGGALLIVSALAWSGGFSLARGTAGFLWTAGLFALLVRDPRLVSDASPLAVVFCPFLLLKPAPNSASAVVAVVISLMVLLVTVRFRSGLDVYLLERQ
jgi:hypothetical protein